MERRKPPARASRRKTAELPARARYLRHHPTEAENLLWYHLRARRLNGCKFRRQVVMGPYIVDFVCVDARLIVEVDGGQHAEQQAYDARRTAFLERRGFRVLRFWNHEVLGEIGVVLEVILDVLTRREKELKVKR